MVEGQMLLSSVSSCEFCFSESSVSAISTVGLLEELVDVFSSVLISNICMCAHAFMWTCRMLRQSFANAISGASSFDSFSTTDLQLPRLYLASVVFPLQLLIKNGVCVSWTRHSHDSSSDVIARPISGLQAADRWFSARPGSFGTPAKWGHL